MRNRVSDQASSWEHLMQRFFKVEEWNVSIRWSLLVPPTDYEHGDDSCVLSGGWCSRGVIRWTRKRKSATLQTMVLTLFDYRFNEALQVFDQIQVRTSAWPIQSFHGFSPQQVLGIRNVWRAWLHRAWTWLVLHRVVFKVWYSLSVEDLVNILPSGYVCPGSRPMAVCDSGKGTTTPWWKRLRRLVVARQVQDGDT